MNTSQLTPHIKPYSPYVKPTMQFSITLLYATLRDPKALLISLGMPLFMLFSIWAPTLGGDAESQELIKMLFPAVVLLSVIMPGLIYCLYWVQYFWQGRRSLPLALWLPFLTLNPTSPDTCFSLPSCPWYFWPVFPRK